MKWKWHSVYGQILFDRKLTTAWGKVRSNKGSGGIDGETLESYGFNADERLADLLDKLRKKEYTPTPVKRHYIPKKNGKQRPLGIPTIEDRIVQQAIVNVLEPKFEEFVFHRWSCGYRPGVGAQRAVQIIMWNIEQGYNHIYDCDIKAFFDHIPHKKLMKILNKYIADGTVLDMIWKWLKGGYVEKGKHHRSEAGTPQGGVISPLLANIYLNELDWMLDGLEGIRFVRYADDFLLFAQSKEDIQKAEKATKETLKELGLEISVEKTRIVDFRKDDFDFLGFTFEHWRKREKDGTPYFLAKPNKQTWKDFRLKIKEKTRKTLTFSQEVWVDRLNPIIRGKVNFYLTIWKAIEENKRLGLESRCFYNACKNDLLAIDGYIRKRLRVAMVHHHPSQRKGWVMTSKWTIEFFAKIGLVPAYHHYCGKQDGHSLEEYVQQLKEKSTKKRKRLIQRKKERGEEYYTPHRVRQINCAKRLATTY